MAENENNNQPTFSIESTSEVGIGDTELLHDLITPESVSSNVEDLHDIKEEEKTPAEKKGKEKKQVKEEKKPVTQKQEEKKEEEKEEEKEEKPPEQNVISEFLEKTEGEEGEKEEETEEKEEEKEGEKEEEKEDDSERTSMFTALAKDLYKLGVFTQDAEDEEDAPITTPQELLDKFQSEKKKGATEALQAFIGRFGEDYQEAFEAIYVNGANPKEYFAAYNTVVDYAQMDMTKEKNQELVIRQALKDQGLDAEDIDTEVDRLKNYGDLESVAVKHHKVLVKKEALKLQQIEQKAQEDLKQKTLIRNQYINNVQTILQEKLKTKEFDGIPLSSKLAAELQDFLLTDKWKTPSGELLTDFDRAILELKRPENHANKVKLGLLLKIMEKDPTLSVIQKSGLTKKSNELFSESAKQVTKGKTPSAEGPSKKKNTWSIL